MSLRIDDGIMSLESGGEVVATARLARFPIHWLRACQVRDVPTQCVRLITRYVQRR
jgi:hypothetical protein